MSFKILAAAAKRRATVSSVPADGGPPYPSWGPPSNDDGPFLSAVGFPELDCVRGRLAADLLTAVEMRAARIGVSADRVLVAGGLIDEEAYLRALGERLDIPFEPLDGVERTRCPLDDERLPEAAATGLVPLLNGSELMLVVAPRGSAARRLIALMDSDPALARRFRLTTGERLTRFVLRYGGKTLAARAEGRLKNDWPSLSAAQPRRRLLALPLAVIVLIAAATLSPLVGQFVASTVALLFAAWLSLRGASVFIAPPKPAQREPISDTALPTVSVIAALYREAASADGLLAAIERMHYPPEKLDVILAIEADDRETRAALAGRRSRIPFTLVTVPRVGPRTKPKALNVALPFARGTFTVVYDAEDRPEPGQVREALQAFQSGGDKLACVQAPLCIDNTPDSWLTQLFTAEYAGQFDVFLPALAAMRLPLPLGGSSNFFRTVTLRDIGGWDPYNVTEDADLGMRLARFGYRTGMIAATTYEEAPAAAGAWLRQRTRWFKGWMQTWLVHMRTPVSLLRDLGPGGFLAFQLIVGGGVVAALVHPLFLGWLAYAAVTGAPLWRGESIASGAFAALFGAIAIAGYLGSGLLGWIGLARRGLTASAWALLLTPAHWLMLSAAAWRALYQLAAAPYAWEKTEHGLARSSRHGTDITHALLELERHLTELKESGQLETIGERPPQTRGETAWRRTLSRDRAAV